ncbi:glucose-6-phosphate isomerase [Saccharopolyspora erythraea NRRL 2338]|uniref:Glucose-6-phosphate isomerase n=2 Tax=Saccharopolyspora erythraea TaxID=1836 RepID=A4FBN9_SACEN|nr:glucose-6-phosphate isomerase [Saccharopolyspora erythraea]EQD87507.1 glucose-6-phosphate isomerase [Saccharopolyspora erythraea D]PFG95242.1 glucose-6-phosphate isomerase [Saccharopolyspora erythraea NRRL 2338]QRK91895.1 glucose-6-phosphate isomerase [Saccharopolyspora erythraea]CAM01464.1 glucose-6-phosphate isomerase [Saccharopolyspora erythraea NRRL 2338]
MATETSVEISDSALADEARPLAERLAGDKAASRLAAQDPTLWGPDAESEASIRLSWTTLHESSRPLLAEIDALRAELHSEGLDRIVLAGMGGSSLAPEVITATAGVPLVVLDTTDPGQVADALAGDLDRTVLVVSSKSGTTVETDSHRRVFERAFSENGIDPVTRIIVVTDPGSPMQKAAEEAGYRKVFTADPNVGGRYSALTAFGLVPAGLAGADIATLLDDAAAAFGSLREDSENNPAVRLAAALGAAHARSAEKVVFADTGSGVKGLPDWAEQLIAESTGKNGTGLLPVVTEGARAAGFADAGDDATTVAIGPADEAARISVDGPLGGQFLLWEFATALAGRLLGIDPFDQPDVEAAKKAARALLDGAGGGPAATPATVDGSIEVHPSGDWLSAGVGTVAEALRAFLATAPGSGYLSVQAYLDRLDDASAAVLRPELARRTGLQTTFGWGPRFLHSTGQYHKGGHQNGVFLQITGTAEEDLEVPGRPYTLGELQRAQALGDGQVLAEHNRPVLRLHLNDRAAGLVELVKAVQGLHQDQAQEGEA